MTTNPTESFNAASTGDRLLGWREVRALSGISRTTAWRLQNAGEFPRPVVISPGRVGWRESDVVAWRATLTPRGPVRPAPSTRGARPPIRSVPPEPPEGATSSAPASSPGPAPPPPPAPRRRPAATPAQLSFDF